VVPKLVRTRCLSPLEQSIRRFYHYCSADRNTFGSMHEDSSKQIQVIRFLCVKRASLQQKNNKVQKNKACSKSPTGTSDPFLKATSAEITDANILRTSDSESRGQAFPSTDCLEIRHQPGCGAVHGPAVSSTLLVQGTLYRRSVFSKVEEL